MDNSPKQIIDVKPTANTQPIENSQAVQQTTAVSPSPAQPQVSLGNPMPSSLQSQAVRKAPSEEMAPDSKQTQEKNAKSAASPGNAIKKTQKNAGGPAAIITSTIILMIVLSALAIFAYLQQNK